MDTKGIAMKLIKSARILSLLLVGLGLGAISTLGQAPIIGSLSQNGLLVCPNLQPGSTASVEWASSVLGPWTNNWAGLGAVSADSNGVLHVSVPMFYRVRGMGWPSNMVLIPAGSFQMGNCMDPEEGNNDELPVHTVYVSAFYMDKYLVTKALWDVVYNWATNHGYHFDFTGLGKAPNHPVQSVNWFDMAKWCNARSEKEGRTPAYYTSAEQTTVYREGVLILRNDWVNWANGYRLPTEAEWEKAARGGLSGQRFPWGNTISWSPANFFGDPIDYAYDLNPMMDFHPTFKDWAPPYTSPVGFFGPNGYGLYDMAGNIEQRCWDTDEFYPSESQCDPHGSDSGKYRVSRGGSWYYAADSCRTANRNTGFTPG